MNKIYYKIMEKDGGNFKTLFHGNFGSRKVLKERWTRAQIRLKVKDGAGKKTYKSGWHIFKNKTLAHKYMKRFKNTRNDKLCIVKCYAAITRQKPTNPEVLLAEKLYIIGEV